MPTSANRIQPADLERGAGLYHADDPFYHRAEDGLDLRELLDILLRGKWIILGALCAGALLPTLHSVVTPPRYSSHALLLVQKEDAGLSSILPMREAGVLGSERNLGNELLVLRESYPLAESVARTLMQMERVPGTDKPFTVLEAEENEELTVQDVVFRLWEGYVMSSQEGVDADALRVTAESTVPEEAAFIANLYASAFEERTRETSREGFAASREFLEGQVELQGQELIRLDDEVQAYMQREGAVALDEESTQIVQQIGGLQAQRDQVGVEIGVRRASIEALGAELRRLESRLSERLGSGLDAELGSAQDRLVELQRQLDVYYVENPELRQAANPGDRIRQLRREIERTRERIASLSERLTDQSLAAASGPGDQQSGFLRAAELRARLTDERVALDGLVAQRAQLTDRLAEYESNLRRIPEQSIELAQLQRERVAREQLYGALESNLQEARVAEQSQLGYAQIIRPAFVADEPFAPRGVLNVLIGALVGLVAGAVVAVAKVRLDHRIHRPDDLKNLGAPVISTVPNTDELIKRDFNGKSTVLVGGREIDSHLVTLLNPMAAASEAYRGLRTSVQFSRPDVVVKTVLVTSANPSEGKSTTAANLAVVMAQSGRRVLLVDADLRKPTAHKKFGVPREPGLIQHLFDNSTLEFSTLPEPADDLFVLPAGGVAVNPSELLSSRRMREVVQDFCNQFDLIIFDAPPVLAATDATLLSTQCDATVVVARAGQTKDFEIQSALDELSNVGASVIGTVLNGFDVTKSYGYKYKYAYRYGSDYAYGSPQA